MDIKDWMAPMVTLAIGASTIFISYKNYQSQTQAKPSELARLELWSKLLSESGIDVGNLPPDDKITAEQREILENYRVFLKRASLESKLRKVGIENNRLFNLLMKRAHSPVKPTPIGFGDSIIYYRLILWLFAFIWIPIATIFLGIPVLISFGAYLYRMFVTRSGGNYVDYSIPVGSLVIIIIGLLAVGGLWYLQNKIRSAIIANNVYFYFWDTYGAKRGSRDSVQAYTERLTAKTYSDLLFIGQHEFAQQFRENMYMAGIQEIDEYPRVLSDSVMLPRNYRVAETTEGEDRIDRFVNWVRSKIGFERLEPRIIYRLEHKDAHKDAKKESAHGEPVATEQGVSEQPVETLAQDKQEDAQKAPEAPASAESASDEPIVAEVSVEAPAEVPAENLAEVPVEDAPTEPVIGGATDSSAAAGADDPTEAFTRILHDAAGHENTGEKNAAGEKPSTEKPKN